MIEDQDPSHLTNAKALEFWSLLRRRLSSREVWISYLFAYGVFAGFSAWGTWGNPSRAVHPEVWVTIFLTPWGWLGGMFWLSPLPWQWRQPGKKDHPIFGALRAVCFSMGWIALFTSIDIFLYRRAGIQVPVGRLMTYNLLIPTSVMVLAGYLISRFEDADRGREEALARANQAQSRLLQSQLHPHVLFNSLNGIAELIVKNPIAAEECVRALSDLLRRLLAAAESSSIAIAEERAMVQDYLALESLRLGPRMQVQWEWDHSLDSSRILPLTLQPLVENAIKHGISPARRGGSLVINLAKTGSELQIEVRNTGHVVESHPSSRVGIGLRNLRERLFLAYGSGASLILDSDNGWTIARVRIPEPILLR